MDTLRNNYSHFGKNTRLATIDIAKGIGIVFVVFGHIFPITLVTQWIYSFHVPIFFIISGFTYRYCADKKAFYLKKFRRLVIPYLCFAMMSVLIYWAMSFVISLDTDTDILTNIARLLYGNSNGKAMAWNTPLWFLVSMFVSVLLMDSFETLLNRKFSTDRYDLRCLFMFLCWTLGILLNTEFSVCLPWHGESALFLTGFSEFGYLLRYICGKPGITQKQSRRGLLTVCACIFFLLGISASNLNGWTDIRTYTFGKYPVLLIISTLSFSLAVLIMSLKTGKCRWICYLGNHSLAVMVMHKFPIMFFKSFIPGVQNLLDHPQHIKGILCGLTVTVLTISLCLLAEKVILAVFPVALGQNYTHNHRNRKQITL